MAALVTENLVEPQNSADETAPVADACPRCQKALVDPAGLGWCSSCGYCKSLDQDATKGLLEDRKRQSLGGVVEAGDAIRGLPMWFWATLLFVAVGVFFCIVMNKRLPEGDNLQRALWTSLQIAGGLLAMLMAQCWALMCIAPDEPTLTFKDAVVPFRLWPMVVKRLPKYKECIWVAVLGLTLAIGAGVFINGMGHWFTYLPKSKAEQDKIRESGAGLPSGAVVVEE